LEELKIKDINPLLEIADNSLYIDIFLIITSLSILLFLIFVYYKKFFKKDEKKLRRIFLLNELSNLDIKNSKEFAYKFTKYAQEFIENNNDIKEDFENLIIKLEKYKYKRVTPYLEKDIIDEYQKILEIVKNRKIKK
jgi:hypothetical protein